jgi:hypothetical protein
MAQTTTPPASALGVGGVAGLSDEDSGHMATFCLWVCRIASNSVEDRGLRDFGPQARGPCSLCQYLPQTLPQGWCDMDEVATPPAAASPAARARPSRRRCRRARDRPRRTPALVADRAGITDPFGGLVTGPSAHGGTPRRPALCRGRRPSRTARRGGTRGSVARGCRDAHHLRQEIGGEVVHGGCTLRTGCDGGVSALHLRTSQ